MVPCLLSLILLLLRQGRKAKHLTPKTKNHLCNLRNLRMIVLGGFPLFLKSLPAILRATALLAVAFIFSTTTYSQTKLLRFPDIQGDRVVFTYGGDFGPRLRVAVPPSRLTSHPGVEVFGKFSPDGKWIAFTGQYDGDEQVYVVPTTGGEPRQLTFYPAKGPLAPRWGWDNQVLWLEQRRQAHHLPFAA